MTVVEQVLFIGKGLGVTLILFFGALAIGGILGISVSVLRRSFKIFRLFVDNVISILRGTPVILQLSFVYFTLPSLGISIGFLTAGVVTLGINSAAYIGEIFRSGIDALPSGQFEAARVLGVTSYRLWKDIIMPQVLRNVWSSLINESIALLKETALISTIGGTDILKCAKHLGSIQFTYFAPLVIAGVYYYGIVLCIEYCGKYVERRSFPWSA
ncbi:amino acid ABC transporter permease [Holospora curviuscula]|uniref:Arginine transport system permease protein ArtQ n=1 Tax=Holospora curviuscula TaxID=1082868 RepID=A0A2S5R897_9PROT|nr:amino acid ABC transporter permease [Holospora curviuscula]PPE03513.1 Arginine transport system permease protein ArtQ [Holospora curviuscula]